MWLWLRLNRCWCTTWNIYIGSIPQFINVSLTSASWLFVHHSLKTLLHQLLVSPLLLRVFRLGIYHFIYSLLLTFLAVDSNSVYRGFLEKQEKASVHRDRGKQWLFGFSHPHCLIKAALPLRIHPEMFCQSAVRGLFSQWCIQIKKWSSGTERVMNSDPLRHVLMKNNKQMSFVLKFRPSPHVRIRAPAGVNKLKSRLFPNLFSTTRVWLSISI